MSDPRSRLELLLARAFGDDEPTYAGSGWMSGTLSVVIGGMALLGVLAFRFPGVFSSPEFRSHYPIPLLRAVLASMIGLGFLFGAISLMLRRRKVLGLTGLLLALVATVGGGPAATAASDFETPITFGLDWFVLNLLLLALVFVPLERAFPQRPWQTTFRLGWATDGVHFLVSHAAVQVMTFLTLLPATTLAKAWQPAGLQAWIAEQPFFAQLVAMVVIADFSQYWVHRAFHQIPLLWRFHAVHHSSRMIDWLAGSRLHPVDAVTTRALVLVPLFLLGFSQPALYAYLVFVSFHAVFIHANFRLRFGWLEQIMATPRSHHWHHAITPVDKNFAVHLPVLDRLFGTLHLPSGEWPEEHGIAGHPVPEGWLQQMVWSFTWRPPGPRASGQEQDRARPTPGRAG